MKDETNSPEIISVPKGSEIRSTKYCPHCGVYRPVSDFGKNKNTKDGLTTYCKDYQRQLSREYQRTKANDFDHIIKNRYSSICQRSANHKYNQEPSVRDNPQHLSYHKQGITLEMKFVEFKNFMYNTSGTFYAIQTSGGIPSIDRIDDREGYRVDNLQIIPLHENKEKALGRDCREMTKEERKKHSEYQKFTYEIRKILRKCEESLCKCDEILGVMRTK